MCVDSTPYATRTSVNFCFFFQAEDGIRDADVTGVQTCAPSRRRHTRCGRDWSSDVCSSDHVRISYAVFCLRSEEHKTELQSRQHLVCRHLLENIIIHYSTLLFDCPVL